MGQRDVIARSAEEQEALGAELARRLQAPTIVYLRGDLGAGKTTFVRGFLRALGHAGAVKSPTYTLIEQYTLAGKQVLHLDLYRLADPEELEFLGFRDLLGDDSVCLIEWPEMGEGFLPEADVAVDIRHIPEGRRLIFDENFDK